MRMLNSLKQSGKHLGREINRAWENIAEGWRELLLHSHDALTHFTQRKHDERHTSISTSKFPRWSLLAGELEETRKDVWIKIELPGLDKDDCQIIIEGNVLHLSGEKRFERETNDSIYHVMERAYGAFRRSIPLPKNVNSELAEASFKNGVLTVRLPKEGSDSPKSITVS
jgi:HSP20 family protein